MTLPVLIISFNNHEFVANTIAQLQRLRCDDIVVIDNASSWDETRAYLDTLSCRVIRNTENLGHLCWARPEIYDTLPDKFCVTDPDLQFHADLPADFLDVMCEMSDRHQAMKVGFALDLADHHLMFQYPDYHRGQSIFEWESKFWAQRVDGEALEVYAAEVDTTFHVFNKRGLAQRQLRIAGAYTAKHLPWYVTNPVIPPHRMTALYRSASRVSTIARFHMRQHEERLLAAEAAMPPVHLYQIAYSEATRAAVEPGYRVLDNTDNARPDWYEFWPIRRFLLSETLDDNAFYGFFSPKFGAKTQLSHAQVAGFVRSAAPDHDVVLFSPQPDMGAFFLNVFEQGEAFDPGLMEAVEGFLASIGRPAPVRTMVMDSSRVVFSNYFVARPAFWREWLLLAEQFFALCEGPDSVLKARCTVPTTYPNAAQRKVFIQERLASLLLSTDPRWRVKAANPFGFGWSMTRFRQHPHEAVLSDALKTAFLKTGFPEYLRAYGEIRARFAAGAQAACPAPADLAGAWPAFRPINREAPAVYCSLLIPPRPRLRSMKQTPAHDIVNAELLSLVPLAARRIVEVGCMQGALARVVRQRSPSTDYVGIDIDPDYAQVAAAHCTEAFACDIEKIEPARWDGLFPSDCWIFGDCLEHLRDPWLLLRRIRTAIDPDGTLLVCVPNAQHWSVQWRLASGNFRYEDSGLLDRTHIRWFTRITLLEMFQNAGWRIEQGLTRNLAPVPQQEGILQAIRGFAVAGGFDPEQAAADALPFQYVFKLRPA